MIFAVSFGQSRSVWPVKSQQTSWHLAIVRGAIFRPRIIVKLSICWTLSHLSVKLSGGEASAGDVTRWQISGTYQLSFNLKPVGFVRAPATFPPVTFHSCSVYGGDHASVTLLPFLSLSLSLSLSHSLSLFLTLLPPLLLPSLSPSFSLSLFLSLFISLLSLPLSPSPLSLSSLSFSHSREVILVSVSYLWLSLR